MTGERGFTIRGSSGCTTLMVLALPVALLLFIAGFGAWGLWLQYWRLRTYVPVQAIVVSAGVADLGDDDNDGPWEPVVHYRYPADDPLFSASRVPPIRTSGSYAWAQEIIGPFRPGQVVTAYHHPVRRGSAFLVRDPQYDRVGWVLVPLAILFSGAYGLRWLRRRRGGAPHPLASGGPRV